MLKRELWGPVKTCWEGVCRKNRSYSSRDVEAGLGKLKSDQHKQNVPVKLTCLRDSSVLNQYIFGTETYSPVEI